ncbi:MAG TPA: dynamin family protein, partial [Symbiobacteriaceae bacterium]|nr:dynamin family protein [Symbiobacteriaceae bacterium]
MRRRRGEAPRTNEAFLNLLAAAGLTAVVEPPLPPIAPLAMGDHLGPLLRRREAWATLVEGMPGGAFAARLRGRLERLAASALAKPVLAVLGQSDAGKSRLINAFLGAEWLTASWTPTTTIPVFIKHRRERPAWMGEDEAWVFGGDWDPSRWLEREYAQSRKLAGGDRQVLYQWGTRQGGRGLGMAGAAILFAQSDLLLTCDV